MAYSPTNGWPEVTGACEDQIENPWDASFPPLSPYGSPPAEAEPRPVSSSPAPNASPGRCEWPAPEGTPPPVSFDALAYPPSSDWPSSPASPSPPAEPIQPHPRVRHARTKGGELAKADMGSSSDSS